mmetsp:Transcript_13436/g.29375  ORF Transcript_13436/g.29375 Transcript_13436/m.29375 type:complete len:493 (+) Transcript_13436:164-1642(+)
MSSTPSLSALQASLRRPAKTGQPVKRAAPGDASAPPPAKKATPGAGAKAPAKSAPAGSLAKGTLSKAPAAAAAAAAASAAAASAPAGTAPKASAKVSAPVPWVGLTVNSAQEVVRAIGSAVDTEKIRSTVRLAEAMVQGLPVEVINHFLRALKHKIGEKAKKEGVAVSGGAAAAQQKTTNVPPAPAPPADDGEDDEEEPSVPAPAPKAEPAKAKAMKAGSVAKAQPSIAKSKPAAAKPAAAKPAAAKPKPQAPAVASPVSGTEEDLQEFVDQINENPVVVDGELDETRLMEVLTSLWGNPARKARHFLAIWQAMQIPVPRQATALNKFLNMTLSEGDVSDRAASIVAELVKGHKVKMRSVEEVLVAFGNDMPSLIALNEQAWQLFAHFLVHVFPKPSQAGWGWSRVGWSFNSWLKFIEQCTASLEANYVADVMTTILRSIQEKEGSAINEAQPWNEGGKLERYTAKMAELSQMQEDEVAVKLGEAGVTLPAA